MSTVPSASPVAKAQSQEAMANEKPTNAVKYKLKLPANQNEVTIGRLKVTAQDIDGPHGPTFVKAIKTEGNRLKKDFVAKYLEEVK